MKKRIHILLAALLILGLLVGCGAKTEAPAPTSAPAPTETPTPTATPAPEPTEVPEEPAGPVSGTPEGSVIFEKDGVKVTTAGLDQDPTDDTPQPIVWVDIENRGDRDVCLGVRDCAVNGVMCTPLLLDYYEEDGQYIGVDYDFEQNIPAGGGGRYALGYYRQEIPGLVTDTLARLEFRFSASEDEFTAPYYISDLVSIETGEVVDHADISALGTVVADDEALLLVIGEQNYDDYFGPQVFVYALNKGETYLGIRAESAEADGVGCDYIYYSDYAGPGKLTAGWISFEGGIQALKGFEALSLTFTICEGDSADALDYDSGRTLGPVAVTYPPQIWGEYENDGYVLEIKPKYNDLVTVETPEHDENGILFTASETASLEAGDFEGAGWLFSIGRIDRDRLHEMLCYYRTGVEIFGEDAEGKVFVYCHPTDVRYARASIEEMQRDIDQWSMLCAWAEQVTSAFLDQNGLESLGYNESQAGLYVARAAWNRDADCYLSTLEYLHQDPKAVDATPYAEYVLKCWFWELSPEDLPEGDFLAGEYLVLGFPEEDVYLNFYDRADGTYIRLKADGRETIYQCWDFDDTVSVYEAMEGWYYACAEQSGAKEPDADLEFCLGSWHEKIAGRGTMEITRSLAPGKANISVRWPGSAYDAGLWLLVGTLDDDGALAYENGLYEVEEYEEDGSAWITDSDWEQSGRFYRNDTGELCWHNDKAPEGSEDSVFERS